MPTPASAYYTPSIGTAAGRIVSGTTTVSSAGTAVQLTATSTPIMGVWLSGDVGNTNSLVVGDSDVDATSGSQRGIVVIAGNPAIFLPINDLSLLWVDAETSGDELVWAYLQPTTSV